MYRGVAVELREFGDMEGNIGACDNGEVHKRSDDLTIKLWICWLFFFCSLV
jgi:hypothetical protein